jgi:KAP family P-loop domain
MQRTGHLSEATEAAGPEAASQPTPGWLDLCAPSSEGSKDITTTDRSGAEARRPVGGGAGGGGRMSIRPVSAQVSASSPPPSFELDLAGNGVYSVEMATDPTLFDEKANHGSRNADTFFSSYQASGLLTALPHQLLEAAWRRPKARDIAGRIGRVVRALARGFSAEIGLPGAVALSFDTEKALDALPSQPGDVVKAPQSLYFAAFQELNAAFREVGQAAFSRIVVFVDDLDRCLPTSALTVLGRSRSRIRGMANGP